MAYLSVAEYTSFGLEATTPESLVEAASALIDAHCRRKGFGVTQYRERMRVGARRTVRLSYLPLTAGEGAASAIVSARGRYVCGRREGGQAALADEVAEFFGSGAGWVDVAVSSLDVDEDSGEVIVLGGVLSPAVGELELIYTAGWTETPEAVKQACARLVKNALATPALNVSKQRIDRMYLEYFADTLVDGDVRRLLAPFVAQRMAS